MAAGVEDIPVVKHSVHTLIFRSLKRTHDMFLSEEGHPMQEDPKALRIKIASKIEDEHKIVKDMPPPTEAVSKATAKILPGKTTLPQEQVKVLTGHAYPSAPGVELSSGTAATHRPLSKEGIHNVIEEVTNQKRDTPTGASLADIHTGRSDSQAVVLSAGTKQLVPRKAPVSIKPQWHPPWKLMRVISGHLGWVRSISVDPSNEWFATGSGDRTIKLWELSSGRLKLTLTGHISSVRGLAVSPRQPYLFSCGEDKLVKCWDLEQNKVIRHYHGHLSGVYCISLHPTIDVLVTAGRDASARVWDMRTKACIHTLSGHTNTIASLFTQGVEPQIVTGSHDSTIRFWDLAAGKTTCILTHHKKSVRAMVNHPEEFTFASASPDNIKQWKFPDGTFLQNLSGHQSIINTLSANSDNVLMSGADNGTMQFWDWRSGYCFQKLQSLAQPGSLDSETGIFASSFDMSGCRLITGEADKTIKIYKEDETATEETHPVEWKPQILRKKRF
ncbi:PREDICTED: pleiotropic regulator 1-like [Amphimedon queenslandica]|uniref:Pleiotropic regulator 1 n=1 Tax=Amphimedon queenslandica TaxID=400682 RepID=A0A1X7VIP5_AMPQE|nr:PREDICTED: pleiotropic regulator 1-like [Amphimedon queenslandica]|eukprot:XP_003384178.1 PREDICTED: pleiotropic regulator 1-like [Amphimedon queenslandica]